MVSLLSFSFSSLQNLLSKISYENFYRKHCKEGGNCHNLFFGYSPNSLFLLKKIKLKKKKKSKNNNSEKRMSERPENS
jgi:hypothetical protein